MVGFSKLGNSPFCQILLLCDGFAFIAGYLTSLILQEVVMDSAVSSSPFLRSVVEAIRVRHYSIRTEKAYIDWIKRFILFHDKRHPAKMGGVGLGIF